VSLLNAVLEALDVLGQLLALASGLDSAFLVEELAPVCASVEDVEVNLDLEGFQLQALAVLL
jgi:hypothetical protein